jgi:hypothetical protein
MARGPDDARRHRRGEWAAGCLLLLCGAYNSAMVVLTIFGSFVIPPHPWLLWFYVPAIPALLYFFVGYPWLLERLDERYRDSDDDQLSR